MESSLTSRRSSGRGVLVCIAAALLLPLAAPAGAQTVPFGKNKVQYSDFDWHVLSGPRVDVYYYPEEEELARAALAYAEESFDSLVVLFRHRPFRRVPLIIYSSHQHFEQTNVTPGFLPEGIAGFTEFLKRRIALPFNGSYKEFRHVIRHELVHFFQLSKLSRVFSQYPRFRGPPLPLWWSEGLAERFSSEQDSDDRMFIRDLVLNGRLPSLREFSYQRSFMAYPLGGELHKYLGERFGYGRVADLYDDLWKYDSFEDAFEGTYGISLEDLDREWRYHLESRFFPEYADRKPVRVDARAVITKGSASFKPAVYESEDGTVHLFFMSPRTGYTTIYRARLDDGDRTIETVLQGERSAEFESFHFFDSRLDVSSQGKLVFVSKYLERDALFIWDLAQEKVVGRYQFDSLVALSSPAWAPDGHRVVFTGLAASGLSDLYVLDFRTQEHYALTHDHYLESDPDWSPDGRHIVFSSDRTAHGYDGGSNLFLYDTEAGDIRYLTWGDWRDLDPRWSPDGEWVVFTSDRTGVHDLWVVNREGRGGRLTDFTGGAFDATWTPDGNGIVFTAFEDGAFNIYHRPLDLDSAESAAPLLSDRFEAPVDTLEQGWSWTELDQPVLARAEVRPYQTRFSIDFAAGEAAFAPGFGSAQGAQFLATDMLGNHMLFLGISAQQFGEISDVLNSFSGQLLYYNLSKRVNWGTGVFRFDGRFVDAAFRNVFDEETFGGFFVASYPFSKFRRISMQTVVERSDRRDRFDFSGPFDEVEQFEDTLSLTRKGVIVSNFLSYVKDNSLWLPTGPIDGMRFNLTGGLITDLSKARAESYSMRLDLRRYFRTSLYSAYAVRLFGYYSDGAIPGRIALGGSHSLRLYPLFGLFGSRAWMVNQEWRFPLTHGMAFAFPFGTIRFPGVQGALFTDLGASWVEGREMEGAWGSYGMSFRMSLGAPLVLRLDVGRRFRLGDLPIQSFDDFYGTTVDFFFGYNY